MTCIKCNGYSVDLLSYRHWLEQEPALLSSTKTATVTAENSRHALICSKCSKIMHKYTISAEHDNKVDVCTTCDDVWLDRGEWELLVQLQLHDKLTDVISAPWQSSMRQQSADKNYRDKYRELLGTEDFKKLSDFKEWLQDHPNEFEIINFLRN